MRLGRYPLCVAITMGLVAAFARMASATTPLEIWVDPDGSAYLYNTTARPFSFDAYQIFSETDRLDPAGWKSIADYVAGGQIADVTAALGPGGLTFLEANPGPGHLAEVNLGGVATLQPGAKFAIGKPFKDLWNPDATADFVYYGRPESETAWGAIVVVPEPSTFRLAALAGLGLLAVRLRR